jgi:hypothetical protein
MAQYETMSAEPALQGSAAGEPAGQYEYCGHTICVALDAPVGQNQPAVQLPATARSPVTLQYEPAVHKVCCAESAGQNRPIAHTMGADAPATGQYEPAGQLEGTVMPAVVQMRAAGHSVAADWPVVGTWLPTGAMTGALTRAGQKWPIGHMAVTAERPAVAQNDPARHAVGADCPVSGANVVAGVSVSADTPAAQKVPTLHAAVRAERPAVAQYEPAMQRTGAGAAAGQ